tara:strand:+ start:1992 stop:2528 length:537 start_codon:yes stop_codon:yes gene_type:complete
MADPMTNFYQGASLGLMPQTRMSEDFGRGYTPIQTTSPFFVDPYRTGDQAAQDTLADLYEAEYQDYLNRFFPVQRQMISEVTDQFPGLRQEEITRAQQSVARAYANISGQQRRRMGGFGLRQSENFYRDLERSQVSATVAARNLAAQRADERRMELMSGNIGGALGNRAIATQGGIGG